MMSRGKFASEFGSRLKAAREKKGWSQKELASASGVPQPSISQAEQGTRDIAPEKATALARALGVTTDYLLTGEEAPARLAPDELPQPVVYFASAFTGPPPDELVRRRDFIAVPLVDGAVAAGSARVVSEQVEDWAWIHQSQIGRRTNLVAVRVRGDSMDPVLPDGSLVVIDRDDRRVVPGAPYVVRVDDVGACTVKYLEEQTDRGELVLIPENREHREQRLRRNPDEPDIVVGRVVWSWRVWVSSEEAPEAAGTSATVRRPRAPKAK